MAEPIADQQLLEGVAYCAHCEWFFKYEMGSEGQKLAAGLLALHAGRCQSNPLVRARDALKAALTTYGRHLPSCALSTDFRWASIEHNENHLDDDGSMSGCSDAICQAWAVAGTHGTPVCTCEFKAALALAEGK